MKIINFLQKNSLSSEREYMCWFYSSLSVIALTLGYIIYTEITQLKAWSSSRAEWQKNSLATRSYNQLAERKKLLESQEQALKDKLTVLKKFKTSHEQLKNQLLTLVKANTQEIQLLSCSLSHDATLITVASTTIAKAHENVAKLSESRMLPELTISSITPNKKQGLTVVLKST